MSKNAGKYVAYLRVSTDRQGRSGLGLEAQRETVKQFVAHRGGVIIAPEYVEIESGKNNDRPKLAQALKRCKLTGATLVVAKLDRLSRNAAFLFTLRDSGADFVAADMPDANTMSVGVMAIVAQHEQEAISERTKAALKAAKARGKVLGGLRPGSVEIASYQRQGVIAAAQKADQKADELRETVEALQGEGLSLNAMAARLNDQGLLTPRGKAGGWTATAVRRVLVRLAA